MRSFYLAWTKELQKLQPPVGESTSKILPQLVAELDGQNLPQPVAEIPRGNNVLLLEKIANPLRRLWYAHKVIEHGWSRAVLTHHIETQLHKRGGKAVTKLVESQLGNFLTGWAQIGSDISAPAARRAIWISHNPRPAAGRK